MVRNGGGHPQERDEGQGVHARPVQARGDRRIVPADLRRQNRRFHLRPTPQSAEIPTSQE